VLNSFFQFGVRTLNAKYGELNKNPYLLDWKVKSTARGVYAFDNDPEKAKKYSYSASLCSLLVQNYQKERGGIVMPTSILYEKLKESMRWQSDLDSLARTAGRNGEFKLKNAGNLWSRGKTYLGDKTHKPLAQMLVRLLVTLDMVVKDPDADIVVRYGNREDFRAALLLFEKITLPRYFGMFFSDALFENYDEVEPYPSWDFWDSIEG
jgi:hypothetical protein